MKPAKVKTSTPDLILTAAERVVLRDGVMRLTLEAVAREAKLSKGGLLYHFATKEALIQAMLARLIHYCEREIEVHRQHDVEPGRWTRAYVRRKLEPVLPYPGEADFPRSRRPPPLAYSIRCESVFRPGSKPSSRTASVSRARRWCGWRWTASG
jgi:AcrR family transcriptional regulator